VLSKSVTLLLNDMWDKKCEMEIEALQNVSNGISTLVSKTVYETKEQNKTEFYKNIF